MPQKLQRWPWLQQYKPGHGAVAQRPAPTKRVPQSRALQSPRFETSFATLVATTRRSAGRRSVLRLETCITGTHEQTRYNGIVLRHSGAQTRLHHCHHCSRVVTDDGGAGPHIDAASQAVQRTLSWVSCARRRGHTPCRTGLTQLVDLSLVVRHRARPRGPAGRLGFRRHWVRS